MRSHLPADVQYSINGMHECLDITNDTAFGIRMFHCKEFVNIHDRMGSISTLKKDTNEFYMNWLNSTATISEKELLSISLFTGSNIQFDQLFENITYSLYNDKDDAYWWLDTIIEHINELESHFSFSPRIEIFNPFLKSFEESSQLIIESIRNIAPLKIKKPNKQKIKSNRKALKKGIELFKNLFGSKMINTFLDGKSFTVSGKHYNYRFTKSSSLLLYTEHVNNQNIQYDLEILDVNTNLVYGKLCTVFKNTPIIDQIIGIILHIKSGTEEKILKNTNVFSKTDHYNETDHYLKILKSKSNCSPQEIISHIAENINVKRNKLEEFQIKYSKVIYKDIQNRIKSKINKFENIRLISNPTNTFDQILDLSSVLRLTNTHIQIG